MESFNLILKALYAAAIESLLVFITHGKSAKSCSQANLFNQVFKKEGSSNRVFLYQQNIFSTLGKESLSIINAKDIWQMLADEIDGTNQLLETGKIYL